MGTTGTTGFMQNHTKSGMGVGLDLPICGIPVPNARELLLAIFYFELDFKQEVMGKEVDWKAITIHWK